MHKMKILFDVFINNFSSINLLIFFLYSIHLPKNLVSTISKNFLLHVYIPLVIKPLSEIEHNNF